jgi:hypothetical protein
VSERFWPVAEAAQADYEALRAAALGEIYGFLVARAPETGEIAREVGR